MPNGSRMISAVSSDHQSKKTPVTDKDSFRTYDYNGWAEIKDNPITKVGVFEYSGAQIADEKNSQNLDLNKIYNVYRPAEELSKAETIESFRLLPFVDEHAMLGSAEEGKMPAEKKGIHGVIGEDVRFDPESNYLLANLKIFSDDMSKSIDMLEKKDISAGYYCDFVRESGVYDGQSYDFVQRNIRGNHIALVWEGRSGPDVSVLDQMKFTIDAKELHVMEIEAEKKVAFVADADESKETEEKQEAKDAEGEYEDFVNKADVTDEDEEKEDKEEKKEAKDEEEKEKKSAGMDAALLKKQIFAEIAQRDVFAEKLSHHIGTFDHASKTLDEVAKYGVKKLKLSCTPGHEKSFLEGFLHGAKAKSTVAAASIAQDSRIESSCIDAYLKDKE